MAAERYYEGQKNNPLEEKRYARDQAIYEKNIQRGKIALKVKPTALIDTQAAHQSIVDMLKRVRADFAAADAQQGRQSSEQMLNYLRVQSSERARRVSKATARFNAIKLMEEVGIPEPRKRYRQYPFQFSGGMRQRVVIAIALSANPDILICDEPTTALDVTIQAQILELINDLKIKRRLSIIFITHDLGVVANMADRIGVMYAGKFVEYGTVDDLFYEPKHPYTWALLASMPDLDTKEKLAAIPGTPPNMILPPPGDAFAVRNRYAMQIDFEQQPPFFKVSDTHYAATWLLHEDAPKVEPPAIVTDRIRRMKMLKGN
ncbi:MAG: ABC transporter ATP-binding protein [Bacillota bacterium]|nr:ABC transporter ATP-binding protein [Bacillota bacterium]